MERSYSLDNARRFNWSSLSDALNPERQRLLERHVHGRSVLDAGCGGGGYVRFLKSRGLAAIGVDYHSEFLRVAKQADPEGIYLQGDISRIPLKDKSVDCSICFDVMEHMENDSEAIGELLRVTRRRILITVPQENGDLEKYGLLFLHYKDRTHVRYYTKESLEGLFRGIPGVKCAIAEELAIPFSDLFGHMVDYDATIRYGSLRRKILGIIGKHSIGALRYRKIYSGLVAIVDID